MQLFAVIGHLCSQLRDLRGRVGTKPGKRMFALDFLAQDAVVLAVPDNFIDPGCRDADLKGNAGGLEFLLHFFCRTHVRADQFEENARM